MAQQIVDHLFRHEYGKMVAILTNFFGLSHIETIEDAVQDTFIKATLTWRKQIPEQPSAWLTKAAKHRTIDLLRQINAEKKRFEKLPSGPGSIHLNDRFLDHEVDDSQLRMIFVACHPSLKPQEQIAFALKTISGFSIKEISAALLTKTETVKKRLSRARKTIIDEAIQFDFPEPQEIESRFKRVMEVIYLTFNEGFHSTNKNALIRKDLCGEAMRLCQLMLKKPQFRSGSLYALFALMCFHSARLESKTNAENEIIDIEHQNRQLWHGPLIVLGNDSMNKSMEYDDNLTTYHYEAAIAAEHLKAKDFKATNWKKILQWYERLNTLHFSAFTLLNIAITKIQLTQYAKAKEDLDAITIKSLEQRGYLLDAGYAYYYEKQGLFTQAIAHIEKAITQVSNIQERNYFIKKKQRLIAQR